MYKIALLLDKKNDWIKSFLPKFDEFSNKYFIKLFFDKDLVENFDVVFALGYTEILNDDFLSSNKLVLIIHESDLPNGRGFSPVQWQILEGKDRIIVSLIKANKVVDSGDIILQEELILNGTELYDEIRQKQANVSIKLMTKFLNKYPNFSLKPQVGKVRNYARRFPKDSELDIDMSLRELFPKLRIANNKDWPSYFNIEGNTYILKIYKKS